ncbi:MAG: polymerase subunit alpha [Homoserinimonas sp.]|nr:polymerase subunit alpha [Homoserinimonas sp.]
MPRFTHLHVASAFSAHYGTTPPERLVEAAAEQGADAAAITDRDGLYGAIRHVRACIAVGIDPIVGVDLGLTFDPQSGNSGRVTVLAHGNNGGAGWAALCRLISAAHGRPTKRNTSSPATITRERTRAFLAGTDGPVGTVLLGADSDVGRAVSAGQLKDAGTLLERWKGTLPGGIVVEVVCHFTEPGDSRSIRHAARMLELAEAHQVPAVLTNAARYLEADDAVTGDVLDAASQLSALGTFSPQPNAQAWLKPGDEMRALARTITDYSRLDRRSADELLSHTEQLADRCRLDPDTDLQWRKPKVPELSALGLSDATDDPNQVLWQRCEAGLTERYDNPGDALRLRLRDELSTITGFGFASYFLTVADVSGLMRDLRVRNSARGSGAGSLVNYLLRISNVDPIEHDLLFERFLGKARSTLPDIDIDVESGRRHEVYRAIFERYGSDRVTLLSMQNKYRARGAVRDAGLALGLDEEQIDTVAKNVWRFDAKEFREVLNKKPELREIAELVREDNKLDLLVDLTERLDRLPRHISMHPCGVILGNSDLLSMTPVQPSGIGLPMSQFDKDDIDDAGLLKLDVLGVRMQSAMAFALDEIIRIHGPRAAMAGNLPLDAPYVNPDGWIELDAIPHDDEPTFEAIRTTNTLGMFQIESPGQRELVGKMQPTEFEDLIADISLFRPGPMKGNMVAPFLDVKHGFARPQYLHKNFIWFLKPTYGVVIYHEQVLRIFADCMGIDLAQADELRRNMEKKVEIVEQLFRSRTAANMDEGKRRYTDVEIDTIWAALKGFGAFGFCKAHGAAFALPTYQSAWLKTHYPAEFLSGILTHDPGMYPKRLLLTEARRMGVPILPLDVNASSEVYHVEPVEGAESGLAGEGGLASPPLGIRLSFSDVHGLSHSELSRIVVGQPYDSITDFYLRAKPSRGVFQRLGQVGALDSLSQDDRTRGDVVARIRQLTARKTRPAEGEQLPLFIDDRDLIPTGNPEPSAREKVSNELDILAMELSEHVVESYRPMLDEIGVTKASDLLGLWNNTTVLVAGIRVATQTPPMRSGKRVVFISLDDGSGCSDSTFFEDAQQAAGPLLFGTKLMLIQGKTRRTGERGMSILAENAWDLKQLWAQWTQTRKEMLVP